VTAERSGPPEPDPPEPGGPAPSALDTSVPHPARVYDYWLGGKDNYAADREAAEAAMAANPHIVPGVRTNREFLGRAVGYLTGGPGIRQFLDIGTGIPAADNTHEVAQAAAPEARIVYVDNDPIVLVHARELLTSTAEGATDYIQADVRDPDDVLQQAAATLDFGRPIAVMMLAILQNIGDADDPHGIVARLMGAVAPGSYLVLSHPACDILPEAMARMADRLNERQRQADQVTFRARGDITRFFDGLDLVEPGVVQPPRWRPGHGTFVPGHDVTAWCGVARKP
jgi:hypothetical protein